MARGEHFDEPVAQERGAQKNGQGGRSLHRILVAYGVGALFVAAAALVWLAADVLLLLFASVLLAVLLHDASCRLHARLGVPKRVALGVVLVLTLIVIGLGIWFLAPRVGEQAQELFRTIPLALERLQASLQRFGIFQTLVGQMPSPEAMVSQASSMLARAGVFFSGVLGAIANVAIITVLAIYLAAHPSWYIRGFVTLFPIEKRPRTQEVLDEIGRTLGQWLMGKLLSMLIIGILTAVGLALLQVPLALVLGVLAGVLDFIPYIGPIIASIPAILIAFTESPTLALYVVLLFAGLQVAEGYLVSPLIERRTVSLPPALTISAQVLLGAIFGLPGVALATPLAAVVAVLVAMLYVQDYLGDPVQLPAER